jgi:hypothetical protein
VKVWTERNAPEYDRQAPGLAVGQRLDQRSVGEDEDSNGGADSEREHKDRSDGEGGILAELAKCVAEILPQRFDEREGVSFAIALGGRFDST